MTEGGSAGGVNVVPKKLFVIEDISVTIQFYQTTSSIFRYKAERK